MKIAVTYADGQIFQHFGHTEALKLYEIEDNRVVNSEIISTEGSGHAAIADVLKNAGAQVLICGGIGGCAVSALDNYGIELYAGVQGSADEAVEVFLNGSLAQVKSANCSHHHGEHHHDGGHQCGHCGH